MVMFYRIILCLFAYLYACIYDVCTFVCRVLIIEFIGKNIKCVFTIIHSMYVCSMTLANFQSLSML